MSRVLIAGGGIAGLSLALTLHEVGIAFTVFESVAELRPLGVGINLQPNAVRELFAMGLDAGKLSGIGTPVTEWVLAARDGQVIHAEPRGLAAGYKWPQFAVHRGEFQMLLARELIARAGPDAVRLSSRATGYATTEDGTVLLDIEDKHGRKHTETGTLLVGADGIHSAIRAQMHPDQPPIHWGGALMWRGATRARPPRGNGTFLGLGGAQKRMVIYPVSGPDADGSCLINWIAEIRLKNPGAENRRSWFRPVALEHVAPHFDDWVFDGLDAPALLAGAPAIFENAMIDRDPVPTWQDGRVVLMGDAAHPMYPTGSNGASQAIMDARHLGAAFLAHGLTPQALQSFDQTFCKPVSELVLRNRGSGPFGLLDLLEERCGGQFDEIETVLPQRERDAFMARYKEAAGFARDQLNSAPPVLPGRS